MQAITLTLLTLAAAVAASPLATRQSSDDQSVLDAHNYYRRQHGAGDLTWDGNLAYAAYQNAAGCNFAHTQNNPYGENLFAGGGDWSYQQAVDSWMSEQSSYNGYSFGNGEAGHYTQVIWKNTQRLGCVRFQGCSEDSIFHDGSNNFATYVVCEYDPPGNYDGEYQQNVQ
ncbi:sterol-binding protein [Tilletia horrida]|uniref:Sterol-binding protein n=1 Tax=Tilletia horrida TaxID=155126 RepID=A0AAN6JU68_9BASI|nr:sterol-binding protein [Tilletia horrida]